MAVIDEAAQHPTEAMLGYTTMLEAGLGSADNPDWQDVGEVTDLTVDPHCRH